MIPIRLDNYMNERIIRDMKNKAVKIGIVASLLPHVFCCGIPIALSIAGLVAPEAAHIHILPHWMEPWLFVVSGCMLAISWLMVTSDCDCECDACHTQNPHRIQKIILAVITVIFMISVVLHLIAH